MGASIEDDYLNLFRQAGFQNVRVMWSFDYFSGTSSADTRRIAGKLGAKAIDMWMSKLASTQ